VSVGSKRAARTFSPHSTPRVARLAAIDRGGGGSEDGRSSTTWSARPSTPRPRRTSISGRRGRVERPGKKAPTLEPDWEIEDGWVIEVQGRPTVRTKVQFLPPPDFQAETLADFMVLGHIMTAMPAINAITAVVAAPPGIVSYPDLPLPLPRGLVRL